MSASQTFESAAIAALFVCGVLDLWFESRPHSCEAALKVAGILLDSLLLGLKASRTVSLSFSFTGLFPFPGLR